MTTFSPLPTQGGAALTGRTHRTESYAFQVDDKPYTLQFWPITYLEGYQEHQLAKLAASAAYEVSFRLEAYELPDGTILGGYDTMHTGAAFRVLGGVANGILDWAQQRQPEYLYWYAQGTRRQRLYERMVRYFDRQGSGWRRLAADPFTRSTNPPEAFWLHRP